MPKQKITQPSGKRAKKATVELVKNYNPAKGSNALVSVAEWTEIGSVVREAVQPLTFLSPISIRPFLQAMTRLVSWAHARQYPLDLEYLLSPAFLEAYVVNQEAGVIDTRAQLSRIGLVNDVAADVHSLANGVPRPEYQSPYSSEELRALTTFARSSKEFRCATLLSIVALGAGAGIVAARMRGVSAASIHNHGDAMFVKTEDHCARVRGDFVELFTELRELRPSGQLIGDVYSENLTSKAATWVAGRVGVPELNVYRLRATYIVSLMNSNTGIRDLLAWTGMQSVDAFQRYLAFTDEQEVRCPLETAGKA
jgi:hypothetical protein